VLKRHPMGAEYRKRRAETKHEFEECKKSMILHKYFI
jgi:hypothetical protein